MKKTPPKSEAERTWGMLTKVCKVCGEDRPMRQFGRRHKTAAEKRDGFQGTSPKTMAYKDRCLPCETDAERKELRAEVEERKKHALEKEIREKTRKKDARQKRVKVKTQQKRQVTKLQAARDELVARELARRSLLGFTKRFSPNYLAGWVHVDICNRLERFNKAVERRENPRLMLFMPPRHGKSNIASQHYPGWTLGHHPDWEFIAASYGSSLPIKFSRYVRSLLRNPRYKVLFPDTVLDKENENVEGWSTTKRGGYIPAGVGGGITGKGANVLVIDDPVKDAEEADSEVSRSGVWDWYGSTALTRLAPESGILVIQTRWHDDDLSGKLIEQMKENYKELDGMQREVEEILNAQLQNDIIDEVKYSMMLADAQKAHRDRMEEVDTWEIVSYPAIAEFDEYQMPNGDTYFVDEESQTPVVPDSVFIPTSMRKMEDFKIEDARLLRKKGEALHPARYPISQLRRRKNVMQSRHWHALYQQNPVPDDGEYFKKEHFRYHTGPISVSDKPVGIAWDLAVGKKQVNDYTVGTVGTMNHAGDVQVVDVIRGRWDTHEVADKILTMHQKYRRMTTGMVMTGIERGQLELAVRPELNRLSQERGIYPVYDPELKPLTDKLVRARPLQGYTQAGKLVFADPQYNAWVEIVTHEMLRFPNGTFDDCVDSLAWLIRMIERNFSRPKSNQDKAHRRDRLRRRKILTVKERLRDELRKSTGGNDPMAA